MRIILAVLFSLSSMALASGQIGFVDMEKVFQSTKTGKKAREQWQKDYDKAKGELSKKESELKKIQEDLEVKKSVMSEEAFAQKQKDFQEQIMKFRDAVAKNQDEIQKRDRELSKPVLERIRKATQKIVQEKGFAAIIELSPSVIAYNPDADVTSLVIKKVEE